MEIIRNLTELPKKITGLPLSALLFFLAGMALGAPAWAALKTQTVEYTRDGTVLEGYLAYDDSVQGPRPGILVVHEWKGLNDYARMRADQLAALGYVAFAADIYGKGVRPQTPQEAGQEAGKYKNDRGLLRQRAAAGLEELKKQPQVDAARLGAIGYCFGGTAVLELARAGADINGVVSFHGGLSAGNVAPAADIKPRILVLHGEADPYVDAAEVDAFKKEMKNIKARYALVSYPGAVHGFTNPANHGDLPGALYDQEADQKSWAAMQEFFEQIFNPSKT